MARKLSRTLIALLILTALAMGGVIFAMQIKAHREEDAARNKLAALVTQVEKRITDGYRADGRLPTVPRDIGTPTVISQNTSHAAVYAHLSVDYNSTVLMPSEDTVATCQLFTLERIGGKVQVSKKKVSCETGTRPPVSEAPHLTAAFMSGIRY
ncbi:hypothetical protein ACWCRD_15300 [Streptomyces sp. NPDC002092]